LRKDKSLGDGMHVMPSLSLREVAIITSSLKKRPKKTINCLVRLKELLGSLGTRNPLKVRGDKASDLKNSGLSISISHKTATHPEIRIFLIITFGSE